VRVVRRTARAILIDPDGRLVLFRRTLPKRKPYWSTPGGGVDDEDVSIEAALHRELAEELGATVDRVQQVFLASPPRGGGIAVSHFFVCRLLTMDLSLRTGEEFSNPAKGRYDVERIDLRSKKLSRYALQPPEIKAFIMANRQALLMAALDAGAPPLTAFEAVDAKPEPDAEQPRYAETQPHPGPRTEENPGSRGDAEPAATPTTVGALGVTPVTRVVVGPVRPGSTAGGGDVLAGTTHRRRARPAALEIADGEGTHEPVTATRGSGRRPRWWRRGHSSRH